MADIATLGLAVDSSQVEKGALSLDHLSASAKRAEAAAGGVSASNRNASAAAALLSASAGKATAALNAQAAAAQKAGTSTTAAMVAANSNVNRMGGSMSGLAAQFQDIGVTAAMEMNPMIIGLQQGTQIAGQMEAAMQGGSSAAGVLGNAFKSLFQPLTFISIALTVLAAAGLQMVDWVKVGKAALHGLADALQVIAPYAALAAAGMALLYAPAIIGGIASITVGLWGMVKALGAAALAFAVANPATAFVLGITAAVAAANIFRDELTKIFGVDIVGAAKTGVNYIIGSFVAAYEDLKFIWNQFPNIVGSAAIGAANAALSGIQSMLNSAAGLLDQFIEKVNGALPGGFSIGEIGSFDLGQIEDPYADDLSKGVGDRNKAVSDALNRDYLGEAGGAIAKGASAAAGALDKLADGLGKSTKAKKKAKTEAERLAEKYNDILLNSESFIATQMAETDALGLTQKAAAAMRFEQEMINKALEAGIKLTPAMKAEIKSYASAMAEAEQALKAAKLQQDLLFERDQLGRSSIDQKIASTMRGAGLEVDFSSPVADAIRFNEQLSQTRELLEGIASDITSGLRDALADGKLEWRELGDIALSVLQRIADQLIKMATDQMIAWLMKTIMGGLGGGMGGGGIGWADDTFRFAKGAAFSGGNVIPFATGGVVDRPTLFPMARGAGLMGEAGPEAILPLKRGPGGALGVAMHGGGVGASISMPFAPIISIGEVGNGVNKAEMIEAIQRAIKESLTQFEKMMPTKVAASLHKINKMGMAS